MMAWKGSCRPPQSLPWLKEPAGEGELPDPLSWAQTSRVGAYMWGSEGLLSCPGPQPHLCQEHAGGLGAQTQDNREEQRGKLFSGVRTVEHGFSPLYF